MTAAAAPLDDGPLPRPAPEPTGAAPPALPRPAAPPFDARPTELEIQIPKLLRGGLLASAALLAAGLFWFAAVGATSANHFDLFELPKLLAAADPRGVIGLGMLLLLLTPLARVAASLAFFARERDKLYVALTGIVLATLVAALAVGAL